MKPRTILLLFATILFLLAPAFFLTGCRTADAPTVEPRADFRQVHVGGNLVVEQHYHYDRQGDTRQEAGKQLSDLGVRADANAAGSVALPGGTAGEATQTTTVTERHQPAVSPTAAAAASLPGPSPETPTQPPAAAPGQ